MAWLCLDNVHLINVGNYIYFFFLLFSEGKTTFNFYRTNNDFCTRKK